MHQFATLGVEWELRSALVDWCREATSVTFGHFLIGLFPRADDRLSHCTNSGIILLKFFVPDNLKHLKHLDDEHIKSFFCPSIQTLFPRMQNSVSENLSKRIYPISERVHRQPAARKLVRSEKRSRSTLDRRN